MKARADRPGPHAQLEFTAPNEDQLTLEGYVADMTTHTREHGLESARRGDPDAFDAAVAAVRAAALELGTFSTDDLNYSVRGGEVGAAFAHLRRLHEIEPCGFQTSRRSQSHGRLIRVWRRI